MNAIFIGGTSTAGKSYLAQKLAKEYSIPLLSTDTMHEEFKQDPRLEPWVNFYWNKNEAEYYADTSLEAQWQNLVDQSEAFWPSILEKV